jgi:hypothetical protein
MPSRPRQLPADHDFAVVRAEAGFAEHGRGAAARGEVEHRLHRRRLRVGTDDVGLGAGAAHEEDGVDEDGLAGARFAGEDVEAGREDDGDVLDDGEVADPQLAQHPPRL